MLNENDIYIYIYIIFIVIFYTCFFRLTILLFFLHRVQNDNRQ